MDDIFIRILDLTSHLSSPVLHLLEDLYFGLFNGHSESRLALRSVEYPSFASYHEQGSAFVECSTSSKHNLATYRGIQRRSLNVKEHSGVSTSTDRSIEAEQTHGGMPLCKRLTLPLCCVRVFWRTTLASWRCFLSCCRNNVE